MLCLAASKFVYTASRQTSGNGGLKLIIVSSTRLAKLVCNTRLERPSSQCVSSHRIMRKGFDMKKALSGTLALAIIVTATAPAIAADYKTVVFVNDHFREPLSTTKVWHRGRKVFIEERTPDVIFLPTYPFVIVTNPHG